MNKIIFIAATVIMLGIVGFSPQISEKKVPQVSIGQTTFTVEIVDTDATRAQGLSGRENLADDTGMLFIFPQKARYSFWMKDMRFPIDIVWIDGDTVVDISESVPAPMAGQTNLPIYQPKVAVDKVLEVNSNVNSINKGDKILLKK